MSQVAIDANLVRSMLTDARFIAAFPCVAEAAQAVQRTQAGSHCGRCGRARSQAAIDGAVDPVQSCIMEMPANKKSELRALLGAEQVKLTRRNSRGVIVHVLF